MWTCPGCGEMHDDRFDACWKCAEVEEPPAPPQQHSGETRSLFPVGGRMVLYGAIAGGMFRTAFADFGLSAMMHGAAIGAAIGLIVGAVFWAAFPYKNSQPASDTHHEGDDLNVPSSE